MGESEAAEIVGCLLIAVVIALFVGLGFLWGAENRNHAWKEECVRRGVAEWKVQDNGATTFCWTVERVEPGSEGDDD